MIAARSRLMERLGGAGAVALLDSDEAGAAAVAADYPGVEVAGFLSPRQTVVAGPIEQVEALLAAQRAANRFARRVNMTVASHTALMDPVCEPLRAELAGLSPRIPSIPMLRTVGDPATSRLLDADYWVANLRQPVQLIRAVALQVPSTPPSSRSVPIPCWPMPSTTPSPEPTTTLWAPWSATPTTR